MPGWLKPQARPKECKVDRGPPYLNASLIP